MPELLYGLVWHHKDNPWTLGYSDGPFAETREEAEAVCQQMSAEFPVLRYRPVRMDERGEG